MLFYFLCHLHAPFSSMFFVYKLISQVYASLYCLLEFASFCAFISAFSSSVTRAICSSQETSYTSLSFFVAWQNIIVGFLQHLDNPVQNVFHTCHFSAALNYFWKVPRIPLPHPSQYSVSFKWHCVAPVFNCSSLLHCT